MVKDPKTARQVTNKKTTSSFATFLTSWRIQSVRGMLNTSKANKKCCFSGERISNA